MPPCYSRREVLVNYWPKPGNRPRSPALFCALHHAFCDNTHCMQPDNLISLKDDMVAFIAGHGMRRFNGYVTEEVPTVIFEDEDPDAWKDFVEHAKAAGASFVTMSEVVLEKSDIAILLAPTPRPGIPRLRRARNRRRRVPGQPRRQARLPAARIRPPGRHVPLRNLHRVVRALPGTHRDRHRPRRHRSRRQRRRLTRFRVPYVRLALHRVEHGNALSAPIRMHTLVRLNPTRRTIGLVHEILRILALQI